MKGGHGAEFLRSGILRAVVTGGRGYDDRGVVGFVLGVLGLDDLDEYRMPNHIEIAHGGARGADTLADDWAVVHWVPVKVYPADWDKHGRRAGILRNIEMVEDFKPHLVVAFPGGRGTAHCRREGQRRGIHTVGIPETLDIRSARDAGKARLELLHARVKAMMKAGAEA